MAKLLEKTWENIQRKTFTGWVNSHLKPRGKTVSNLEQDLADGLLLVDLLEAISGESFPYKYEKNPNLRIKKVGNVGHCLKFIESKGVKLAGIGPEEIVDSNLKMCLGLIWTIILRFQIQDISMEELSAKEALLRWCQLKTEGYRDVKVQNFHTSWQDGLAFCAIIHKHRPDLLDFNALSKENKKENLELAFKVAEEKLGIPRLLDPNDIVDVEKPDERSIITYVSLYYHYFSQQNQGEVAARRLGKLVDFTEANDRIKADYSDRAAKLRDWIQQKEVAFQSREFPNSLSGVEEKMNEFGGYRKTEKSAKNEEKTALEAMFNSLQTKLQLNHRPPFEPPAGLSPADLNSLWNQLEKSEHDYSLALLAEYRRQKKIKDLITRLDRKLAKLVQWIADAEKALARRDDLGDSLAAVRAKLKNHEAFEEEANAVKERDSALQQIRIELAALKYPELDSLDSKLAEKDKQWSHMLELASARKQALLDELAKKEKIEDLLLGFAKRALAFRVWANEADDQLTDTVSVETVAGVQELQNEFQSFLKTAEAKKQEIAALNELAGQLKGLGVSETSFSELSIEDVNALWRQVETLIEQRRAALEGEQERQRCHEALRVKFAEKARELAEFVQARSERLRNLSGSPEEQQSSIAEIHAEVKGSAERYTELTHIQQELDAQGIVDNPHTTHTIESLRAAWNNLAVLIGEKGKAIDAELAKSGNKSSLSPEQVREFKDCFHYFDKDKDTLLNRLELFGCLKELPLDEGGPLDQLIAKIDSDQDGKVNFQDFLNYMEKLNSDADTPDQINEAFTVVAGGKEYVTEAQLRACLPPEKVAYLLKNMPAYPGVEGAYDYRAFTQAVYNR